MRRFAESGRRFICLFLCLLFIFGFFTSGVLLSESLKKARSSESGSGSNGSFASVGLDGWMRAEPDFMTEAFEIPLTFSPALEGKPYRTGGKSGCLAVILLVTIIAFRLYAEEWPEAVAVRQVAKRITDTLHEQDGKK